jgi:hypothetical protein
MSGELTSEIKHTKKLTFEFTGILNENQYESELTLNIL